MDSGSESDSVRFYPDGISFDSGSNILGDYEKGTFTPVLSFGGGTTGITYSLQAANYIRIGDLVNFNIRMVLTSKGTDTGIATITGLSITPDSSSPYHGVIACTNLTFSGNYVEARIVDNSGFEVQVQNNTSGSATTSITDSGFANNTSLRISGSFITA